MNDFGYTSALGCEGNAATERMCHDINVGRDPRDHFIDDGDLVRHVDVVRASAFLPPSRIECWRERPSISSSLIMMM